MKFSWWVGGWGWGGDALLNILPLLLEHYFYAIIKEYNVYSRKDHLGLFLDTNKVTECMFSCTNKKTKNII